MKSVTASITMLSLPFLLLSVFCFRFSFQLGKRLPPNCTRTCGNVSITFPFGIEDGCFRKDFKVICSKSGPYLEMLNLPIQNIELPEKVTLLTTARMAFDQQIRDRNGSVLSSNPSAMKNSSSIELKYPFTISGRWTKFVAMGCDTRAYVNGSFFSSSCECQWLRGTEGGIHGGLGHCHISIPDGQKRLDYNVTNFFNYERSACASNYSFAVLVMMGFDFDERNLLNYTALAPKPMQMSLPLVADWAIDNGNDCNSNGSSNISRRGNGSVCYCKDGWEGNPYLEGDEEGCHPRKDAGKKEDNGLIYALAGIGLGVSIIGASYTYGTFAEKKLALIRQDIFIQNGGEILKNIISQSPDFTDTRTLEALGDSGGPGSAALTGPSVTPTDENPTIFTQKNLIRAIKLLKKGHDVAVKIVLQQRSTGILPNGKNIDIRPFKMEDRSETEQFMKEIVTLKRFKHPYWATLVGCCLETTDPSLVYEYVSENTLYDHLHSSPDQKIRLSWADRLMIAKGTARALARAHDFGIWHRDVRSANILLDERYNPKVVEFGVTRLLSTASYVSRTVGYLDPEYTYTNLLTEKSDVYSFGVVLVELISGRDPTSSQGKEKGTSLAKHFILEKEQNGLKFIAEADILTEAGMDVLNEVAELAELARRCLQFNGKERPAINEVAATLSLIGGVRGDNGEEDNGNDDNGNEDNGNEDNGNEQASFGLEDLSG